MPSANGRIGIVGAGTSGVFLALLLHQQGFDVTVFEKAQRPRTEGCGILLVRDGMKALHHGYPQIYTAITRAGTPAKRFEFRNLRGGIISAEDVTVTPGESSSLLIHRTDILEALLAALPTRCLQTNSPVESLVQTDDSVTVNFSTGSQWSGDVLIGADGILSTVRQCVAPHSTLNYLGDLVWRGVVTDTTFCPEGHFIVYTRGRGVYANFFSLGNNRTHWGFFTEETLPQGDRPSLCPDDPTLPATELAKIPNEARAVIESTPPDQIVTRYSYDLNQLPRLVNGRVALIGDAAHAMSPTRARGMTSGLEDALSLANQIESHSSLSEALAAYEIERLPIVHEYQQTSRELSQTIGRKRKQVAQPASH